MSNPPAGEPLATVSSKGQIVIPADIRARLGLRQGSIVRFVMTEDGVRLVAFDGDIRRLKGSLQRPGKPVSVQAMNAAILARRKQLGRKP